MGGAHGFGPVEPERRRAGVPRGVGGARFALTLAMGAAGGWNIDESRYAREDLPPASTSSRLLRDVVAALERLLAERRRADEPAGPRA